MSKDRTSLSAFSSEQIGSLLNEQDSEDELWNKLAHLVREDYGITSMMYAFTHSKYTVSRTGIMPSIYLRHNYPDDYLATFPDGLNLDDSVAVGLLLDGKTPLLWNEFSSFSLTERQRARIETDQAFGLDVGVSFGFRFGGNSGISALCWASRHGDAAKFQALVDRKRAEMENLAGTFDAMMRPVMIRNRITLTPREKEVISYSAGGMSAKQIADHLKLRPKTVINTLERARRSLGAVSTMEAVAKALVYELI